MNNIQEVKRSDMNRRVTQGGRSVQIDIYEDGKGGWLLEIIDDHGNSTCWDDSFAGEQAALDEGVRAIEEEGIGAFVGSAGGPVSPD
jgi:hypothetical protein